MSTPRFAIGALSALAFSSSVFCAACTVHSDDDHYYDGPSTGTVTVRWTIDGAPDPGQCQLSGSASLSITIDGTSASNAYTQDCTALATTIELPPGSYAATLHLED